MRKIIAIMLLFCLVSFFNGCGHTHTVTGTVVEKVHEEARSRPVSTGKITVWIDDDEAWILIVERGGRKKRAQVPKRTYDEVDIGNNVLIAYDNAGKVCRVEKR